MPKLKLKKKYRNFLLVYVVMSALMFTNYTFSRYIVSTDREGIMQVAKFNVKVNNIDVVVGEAFDLTLNPTTTTTDNKMAPDSEGYFEIEIDPTATEVSLEYQFVFDLSALDEDVKLTDVKVNDQVVTSSVTDNTVTGDLLLPSTGKGFTEQDKINIKVGWTWQEAEDTINPEITSDHIKVSATIRQKID